MARPKKEPTEPLQIRVPVTIKRELKIDAASNDMTMSQILLDGYELYKKKNGKQ